MNRFQQIKNDLKQARNYAYLCKYNESIKLFKYITDLIEQEIILNNVHKNDLPILKALSDKIKQEKFAVEKLMGVIGGFGHGGRNGGWDKYESLGKDKNLDIGIDKSFANFGNVSNVHYSKNSEQINKKTVSNFRTTTRGFSGPKTSNKQIKDPDVWDPPPTRHPIKKTSIIHNQSSYPVNPAKSSLNQKSRPNPKKSNTMSDGKKSFLYERYGDGNGPDANLIEMLERQVMDKSPGVSFDDIAQLQNAKGLLQEAVLLPLKMPQFFTGIRRAWKGVLLFGPPGTGKTLLAKAVASSGGTTFFNVSASSLASKWKGESQKLVRILFEMARFYGPSVIFFDQIDSLGSKRKDGQDESNRKVKTQLLVQMDGANVGQNQSKFVIVLAATNRPWDLDEALRRRLQKRIYIPLPTQKGRHQLIKINLKSVQMKQDLINNLNFIIHKTQGYSGADITNVCRQAAYMPMRRKLKNAGGFKNILDLKRFEEEVNVPIGNQDFIQALKNVNKSVGKDDLKKYQIWMNEFGTV